MTIRRPSRAISRPLHRQAVTTVRPTRTTRRKRSPCSDVRAGHPGATAYTTFCLHCHGADGKGYAPLFAPLAGNPNVLESDPTSLINVTLNGTGPLVIGGMPAAYPMPAYHPTLDDQQVADLLTFIRGAWNNHAPAVSAAQVAKLRKATVDTRPGVAATGLASQGGNTNASQ